MKLSQIGELSLLEQIRRRFTKHSPDIVVCIGDDSAVLKPTHENLLVTTDMIVEGIHFNPAFITPYQLGFKLVSVNVSDIYAMGGKPRFLLLNISVNKNREKEIIDRFFEGIHRAMRLYNVSLVGGDLSASKKGMSLSATLIGYAKKHIRRSGAKIGDRIYVTGFLGDSACGLEVLKKIKRPIPFKNIRAKNKEMRIMSGDSVLYTIRSKLSKWGLSWDDVEILLKRHLTPEARCPERFLQQATSMIDISDGLLIDLSRLCDESKVGAKIYRENIPVSFKMKKTASCLGISAMKLALSGGEDYELLFTAPAEAKIKAIHIGDITESERVIVDHVGRKKRFSAEGYQHFVVQS